MAAPTKREKELAKLKKHLEDTLENRHAKTTASVVNTLAIIGLVLVHMQEGE